jgi:hypothetical protein
VAIAAGQVDAAAKKVESALAGLLSLAISFLAGFLGLGNIASKVMGVIEKVRAAVDKALDTAIAWIVGKAKALFAKLFGKKDKDDTRTEEQKARDVRSAVEEATKVAEAHRDDLPTAQPAINAISAKYKLTKLTVVDDVAGDKHHITGEINPSYTGNIFIATSMEELLKLIPAGAKSDVREAVRNAPDKQKAIQNIFDTAKKGGLIQPTKTMSFGDEITVSGWGTLDTALIKLVQGKGLIISQNLPDVHNFIVANAAGLSKYGYTTKPFVFDPKVAPGAYFQSHAEKQAFISALDRLETELDTTKKKAIANLGVTRPVCPDDCFPFFNAVSQLQGRTIVLADPTVIWIFTPSGQIIRKNMKASSP